MFLSLSLFFVDFEWNERNEKSKNVSRNLEFAFNENIYSRALGGTIYSGLQGEAPLGRGTFLKGKGISYFGL